ncbi:hypothetical protein HDA43_001555 [Streptosporangium sandarakinum]|uniref:Uncharacterized protein n=1 Tax=Streptosporangium sandarakinum TaxID=1260955 RepID=A0A852UV26_9ACTN|nr:hypothetical protein [Streptosporangium sandarakinum]
MVNTRSGWSAGMVNTRSSNIGNLLWSDLGVGASEITLRRRPRVGDVAYGGHGEAHP